MGPVPSPKPLHDLGQVFDVCLVLSFVISKLKGLKNVVPEGSLRSKILIFFL